MPTTSVAELLERAFREKRIEGFISSMGGPYTVYVDSRKHVLNEDEVRTMLVDLLEEPAVASRSNERS